MGVSRETRHHSRPSSNRPLSRVSVAWMYGVLLYSMCIVPLCHMPTHAALYPRLLWYCIYNTVSMSKSSIHSNITVYCAQQDLVSSRNSSV